MAHKHNRRRVRPRARSNRQNYHINNTSYETLSLRPQFAIPESQSSRSLCMRPYQGLPQYISGITYPHNLSRMTRLNKDVISPKSAISVESERIKMFGGEPGDLEKEDIGLCFKMAEVFEGMDWVNV